MLRLLSRNHFFSSTKIKTKNTDTHTIIQPKEMPSWATVNPWELSSKKTHYVDNLLNGKWGNQWQSTSKKKCQSQTVIDAVNGQKFVQVSMVKEKDLLDQYVKSQKNTPSEGLHNPIKNVSRYNKYGDVFFNIAAQMRKTSVKDYFTKLIQRTMPKSTPQCEGEVVVTRKFFQNFAGDNPRFLQRSFNVSGDHDGQTSSGYRWPYGNVCIIAPFNFPLEIPALQLFGCLLTGNKPLLKCDTKMSIVMEQFLRMSISCGMPKQDVNFINCSNQNMEYIIDNADFKVTQFTGSSKVAEHLATKTRGKIRIQDAGFNWKILGPDVKNMDYVSWVADQDAYAASGQKCSAQSIVFAHQNWIKAGFLQKIEELAARRKFENLTAGPVFTWTNERIKDQIQKILSAKSQGSKPSTILFGGQKLPNNTVPKEFGCFKPTAIQVPLKTFLENIQICTTQIFGPVQLIVSYKTEDLDSIIKAINSMKHFLTAGVVSNDVGFVDKVIGSTKNGVTYVGLRARTTGAPQNHWFGPTGDPRGAGIGTKEAILTVWTTHREIIRDYGAVPSNWKIPPPS